MHHAPMRTPEAIPAATRDTKKSLRLCMVGSRKSRAGTAVKLAATRISEGVRPATKGGVSVKGVRVLVWSS